MRCPSASTNARPVGAEFRRIRDARPAAANRGLLQPFADSIKNHDGGGLRIVAQRDVLRWWRRSSARFRQKNALLKTRLPRGRAPCIPLQDKPRPTAPSAPTPPRENRQEAAGQRQQSEETALASSAGRWLSPSSSDTPASQAGQAATKLCSQAQPPSQSSPVQLFASCGGLCLIRSLAGLRSALQTQFSASSPQYWHFSLGPLLLFISVVPSCVQLHPAACVWCCRWRYR